MERDDKAGELVSGCHAHASAARSSRMRAAASSIAVAALVTQRRKAACAAVTRADGLTGHLKCSFFVLNKEGRCAHRARHWKAGQEFAFIAKRRRGAACSHTEAAAPSRTGPGRDAGKLS